MDIYLPIAGQSVNALFIVILGFLVGVLSGMFGVGGGFLTTPLLIFYGIPPTVAVASASTQITGASVSGVMVHMRRGGVDVKMGGGDDLRRAVRLGRRRGAVPPAPVERPDRCRGRLALRPHPRLDRRADAQGRAGRARLCPATQRRKAAPRHNRWVASLPLRWRFYSSGLYISPVAPVALGFLAGMLTVFLGIGGGFILVPAMIYLLGMPARIVIGTSLVMILAVSAATTMVHALTTRAVDIVLAGLLLVGGVIGAQYGALLTTRDQARPAAARARRSSSCSSACAWRSASPGTPTKSSRSSICERAALTSLLLGLLAPLLLAADKPVLVPDISARAGADPLQLHRRPAAAVRRGRLSGRAPAGPARRYRRGPARPGPADPGAREAEDRGHLDERGFQPLPLGAVFLRGRFVASDRPSWSTSAPPRSTSWACTTSSFRRAAARFQKRSAASKPACSTSGAVTASIRRIPRGVEINGGVLYRATITIPSQVPVGTYTAETFLIDRRPCARRRDPRHPDRQVGLRAVRRAGRAPPRASSTA